MNTEKNELESKGNGVLADVSGLLPSLEEFAEQKEKYLKQNGYDTIGNAQKIWQDAANWALNYVAKKAKGNSH